MNCVLIQGGKFASSSTPSAAVENVRFLDKIQALKLNSVYGEQNSVYIFFMFLFFLAAQNELVSVRVCIVNFEMVFGCRRGTSYTFFFSFLLFGRASKNSPM